MCGSYSEVCSVVCVLAMIYIANSLVAGSGQFYAIYKTTCTQPRLAMVQVQSVCTGHDIVC